MCKFFGWHKEYVGQLSMPTKKIMLCREISPWQLGKENETREGALRVAYLCWKKKKPKHGQWFSIFKLLFLACFSVFNIYSGHLLMVLADNAYWWICKVAKTSVGKKVLTKCKNITCKAVATQPASVVGPNSCFSCWQSQLFPCGSNTRTPEVGVCTLLLERPVPFGESTWALPVQCQGMPVGPQGREQTACSMADLRCHWEAKVACTVMNGEFAFHVNLFWFYSGLCCIEVADSLYWS